MYAIWKAGKKWREAEYKEHMGHQATNEQFMGVPERKKKK